jgi:hypothetical protein
MPAFYVQLLLLQDMSELNDCTKTQFPPRWKGGRYRLLNEPGEAEERPQHSQCRS